MARFAERDEYQVSTLVGGLATCTFRPKMYHRVITNIVVGNTLTSSVKCYRGILGSTPVAQSLLGANNTLQGAITIPAGQTFFVQWSTGGTAFARVSWERSDNPLDPDAVGQIWTEEAITSLQIPTAALPNEPAIIIGNDLPTCMQGIFSSAIFWRPPNSLAASGSAPYYFIAQRVAPSGGSGWQQVDHGFLIDDGTNPCGYVVYRRVKAHNVATVISVLEQVGNLEAVGGASMGTREVFYNTDFVATSQGIFGIAFGPDGIDITGQSLIDGQIITSNTETVSGFGNAATNENAGNFIDWPTAESITLDKKYDSSRLNLRLSATFYASNTTTGPEFAIQVDDGGGASDISTHLYVPALPAAGARLPSFGEFNLNGYNAGIITFVPRYRRFSGAGTVSVDTNDFFSMSVTEINQ